MKKKGERMKKRVYVEYSLKEEKAHFSNAVDK